MGARSGYTRHSTLAMGRPMQEPQRASLQAGLYHDSGSSTVQAQKKGLPTEEGSPFRIRKTR